MELYRGIEDNIEHFFASDKKEALLITGARQVGKTFIIRKCAKKCFEYVVEINFIEKAAAVKLFENARSSEDILLRISALTDVPLVPGKTVIFFDEVQECKEIVTAVKFLVEDGRYKYILSGSLLGVELKDIRSVPVGYMSILEMYPLNFFEFCRANKVSQRIFDMLEKCWNEKEEIDQMIHEKLLDLFHLYLIVGGMPAVVECYLRTKNLQEVFQIQKGILQLYKKDIAKYDPQNKLYLEEIFNLIPSELNSKNKRFILKNLNENFRFSRYEHSFIWLKEAGVALPAYCVQEPEVPLLLSRSTNLFKLFLSDVGMLTTFYGSATILKLLDNGNDVNCGAMFENAIAQELRAHGFKEYYFNNKKHGEVDFLIEYNNQLLPIEVKSGKDYQKHSALSYFMSTNRFDNAFVLSNYNVKVENNTTYYPIYMIMFIHSNFKINDKVSLNLDDIQI